MTTTKEDRIAMMKSIAEKLDARGELAMEPINFSIGNEPVAPTPKKRGRPRKNVVAETDNQIATESFDFDVIKDDVGVVLPQEEDVAEELRVMATYLDK
jgi:hypothetical protein